MKLSDLDAEFIRAKDDLSGDLRKAATLAEANGVMFLCPLCFTTNGGRVGTHMVICWFTGVSLAIPPHPGRWNPSGTSMDDLTFVPPGAVSVLLTLGCKWHGFVKNGKVEGGF